MRRRSIGVWIVAVTTALGGPAKAGGGGLSGGSTEVTQLLNHGLLSSEIVQSTKTNVQLATSYATQLQQYANQLLQYKAMLQAGLSPSGVVSALGLQGVVKELNNVLKLRDMVTRLQGNLTSLGDSWTTRFNEASLRRMDWKSYVESEIRAIANKNEMAVGRLKRQQALMESVDEDYKKANEYASQISGTEGVHQSMGLMNAQMNRLIQQNARLTEIFARAHGEDAARKEAEQATNSMSEMAALEAARQKAKKERSGVGQFQSMDINALPMIGQ